MQPITQERIDDLVYRQLLDNIKTNVWKSGESFRRRTSSARS